MTEINKAIQYKSDYNEVHDGQLGYDNNNRIFYKDGNNVIDFFGTYTPDESAQKFVTLSQIPIDRFGDNTYLPLDIKGDFKGPTIRDDSKSAILIESDGSLVGLRSGYNSNTSQLFYFYSNSGRMDSNLVVTDSPYEPRFLNIDNNGREIITRIVSSNKDGMLVEVNHSNIRGYQRYFWIIFNGTMDSSFHSYIDVTQTVTSNSLVTLVYVKERNIFVGCVWNSVRLVFFNNNLPIRWDYAVVTNSNLSTRNFTVTDPITKLQSTTSSIFDIANTSSYLTVLNNAAGNTTSSVSFPVMSKSAPQFTYDYDSGSDTLIGFVRHSIRVVFTDGQARNFSVIFRISLSNTHVQLYQINDGVEQTDFPLVFDIKTYPNVSDSGDVIARRANRYPLINGDYFDNEVVFPINRGVAICMRQRAANSTSVLCYNITHDRNLYSERPYVFNSVLGHVSQGFTIYPPDASYLGKAFTNFSFVSESGFQVNSSSLILDEGGDYSSKLVTGNINTGTSRLLDYGTVEALGLPSNIGITTTSDLFSINRARVSNECSTNGYKFKPYDFRLGSHLNGMEVYRYGSNKVREDLLYVFNTDTSEKLNQLVRQAVSTTNTHNPENIAGTITFLNTYSNSAYFILTFSASRYGISVSSGHMILSAGFDPSSKQVTFGNNWKTLSHISNRNGALEHAAVQECSGSHGIFYDSNRIFVNVLGAGFNTVGGNNHPNYAFEIDYTGNLIRWVLYTSSPSWIQGACGVHPNLGWYSTNVFEDFQTRVKVRYSDFRNITDPMTRVRNSFNDVLGSPNIKVLTLLTIEPPTSLTVYMSSIPLQFQGASYILPTQSISLLDIDPTPYNKVYNCYIQRNEDNVVLLLTESVISESDSNMFVGTIRTNNSAITQITIEKKTRLNQYHTSSIDNLMGKSFPFSVGSPSDTFDNRVYDTLIFPNDIASEYMKKFTPPTATQILNSWARTDNQDYFPDPSNIPSNKEASLWYIDGAGNFVQPNNTVHLNTIISPDYLDRYTLTSTLTSSNGDDDYIGLVVSADYINGEYIALIAGIHTKGLSTPKFSIQLYRNGVGLWSQGTIVGSNSLPSLNGWSNNRVTIQVIKDRNKVKVRRTNWNSSGFVEDLDIDIYSDLPSELNWLADKQRYGFATLSQADSKYLNYSVDTGSSFKSDTVYNYSGDKFIFNNNSWSLSSVKLGNDFSLPRNFINPLTKDITHITDYSTNRFISSNGIKVLRENIEYYAPFNWYTFNITKEMILSDFEYSGPVVFDSITSTHNVNVIDNPTFLRVTSNNGNGYFYILVTSGDLIRIVKINIVITLE